MLKSRENVLYVCGTSLLPRKPGSNPNPYITDFLGKSKGLATVRFIFVTEN